MILRIGNKINHAKGGCKRFHRTEKGLTLIEVLMAVSILAIGIVGVLRAYAGSIATLEVGQYSIDAVNLLKQKITDAQQVLIEEGEDAANSDSGASGDFLWKWEIQPTDIENLNELTVTVSHNFNPRIFSLKTYAIDPKQEEEEK